MLKELQIVSSSCTEKPQQHMAITHDLYTATSIEASKVGEESEEKHEAIKDMFSRVTTMMGTPTILVHCAGVSIDSLLVSTREVDVMETIHTNLVRPILIFLFQCYKDCNEWRSRMTYEFNSPDICDTPIEVFCQKCHERSSKGRENRACWECCWPKRQQRTDLICCFKSRFSWVRQVTGTGGSYSTLPFLLLLLFLFTPLFGVLMQKSSRSSVWV